MNVCTSCGRSTIADTCPYGCKSSQDPLQPKPTISWDLIPTHCWDCGKPIQEPPHQRTYMGMCQACTDKAVAKQN